jgi:tetratricopeptide (TPR) repeat protein
MRDRIALCLSLVLIAATLAVYGVVLGHAFLYFDDDAYVHENALVKSGLSAETFAWAFTTFHAANWHPLTWLSHMLDWQIYGPSASGHHLTSVLWHAANVSLLFLALCRMTGEHWRPALAAGLFALHPLHVESVAWVAERKDELSTFFGLLTLGAYTRYAVCPSLGRYLVVAATFALSLLAKPMLVTLPFVLLLLDYWPLKRLSADGYRLATDGRKPRAECRSPLWEKLPLLVLSAISCVVTIIAQRAGETATSLERLSWGARIANALCAYVVYLRRVFWPVDLAIVYPHPGEAYSRWAALGAAIFLTAVTIVAWALRHRMPAILVGWLWYLGTLVPVIGLIQVGPQALADRYTYFPLIGVFIALAWALPSPAHLPKWAGVVIWSSIAGVLAACALATVIQLRYWQDDRAVWERVLAVTKNNPVAHLNWGTTLYRNAEVDEAEEQLRAAIQLSPGYGQALYNLGIVYLREGKIQESEGLLSRAVSAEPGRAMFQNGLGLARYRQADFDEAVQCFQKAVGMAPAVAEYHFNLASALEELGESARAAESRGEGLRLAPSWPVVANGMAYQLLDAKNPKIHCPEEALLRARQACQSTDDRNPQMLDTLASAYAAAGCALRAVETAQKAVEAAKLAGPPELVRAMEARLRAYEAGLSSHGGGL